MKRGTGFLAAVLLILLGMLFPACAEEAAGQRAKWTVMFYFCGSDLESGHSYASGNIGEIADCVTYEALGTYYAGARKMESDPNAVNIVLETGGSKEWHAQGLGMNVRTDVLQRWQVFPGKEYRESGRTGRIEQVWEGPLSSMAAPETLTDFIRWSAENYPAEKYALVLWDHGMGALKGMFIDELFDGDTMPLYDLKKALSDSGVHFETIVFDACLMANLETAYAIKDCASWMIASEELVAGNGTAINYWLQTILFIPDCDGLELGRWICDMNMYKYSEMESAKDQNVITWSVIDLSKIDRVAAAFDSFFAVCNHAFVDCAYDYDINTLCAAINDCFEFGMGDAEMIDLAYLPFHPYTIMNLPRDVYQELLYALTEAVQYNTHGPERATAGGLSFCYANQCGPEQLDEYALVCPSAQYLALLDAINPNWEAPDWVFEKAEKLPEIVDFPNYQIHIEKEFDEKGSPEITVTDGFRNLRYAYVDVLRPNPDTGNVVCLGHTDAIVTGTEEGKSVTFGQNSFDAWPTLEGVHCNAQLVSLDYFSGKALYQIPLQMGGKTCMLRCGVDDLKRPPSVIYGIWEGYNGAGAYSRNVMPLSKVAGQEFCLLYPIDGPKDSPICYETGKPMTMYRQLNLTTSPLEPGTYYMDYYVEDVFKRMLPVGRVEVEWDGENITVAEGAWEGEMMLTLPKENQNERGF